MTDAKETKPTLPATYVVPKVWTVPEGGFMLNSPTAGARTEKDLPKGDHKLQLYSLGTPNGAKVTILLEELLALGVKEAEYDAWLINIGEGAQFTSGFVGVNPNSKIPALLDYGTLDSDGNPTRVFESGSIVLYLAEKFNKYIPQLTNPTLRAECMNWVFWGIGSAPYVGGGVGHFYHYAKIHIEYCIDRFAMEAKRQLDVLDKHLATRTYICGDEYTIADMINFPWHGLLVTGTSYNAQEFLQVHEYKNVARWAKLLESRDAVARGIRVNSPFRPNGIMERHSAADFDSKKDDADSEKQE